MKKAPVDYKSKSADAYDKAIYLIEKL